MSDKTSASSTPSLVTSRSASNPLPSTHRAPGKSTPRRRRRTTATAPRRPSASQAWVDVDSTAQVRKQPSSKHSTRRNSQASKVSPAASSVTSLSLLPSSTSSLSSSTKGSKRNSLPPSLPQLSQTAEVKRPKSSVSRTSTKGAAVRRRGASTSLYQIRHSDNASIASRRRSGKLRTGGVSKRDDSVFKFNPSLLSVLTSLTGASSQSGSSSATITQQSFNRQLSEEVSTRSPDITARLMTTTAEQPPALPSHWQASALPVFQYMHPPSSDEGHDGQSVVSSSPSSQYAPSDAGSSELPDTPSSRSTFPSPTATRSGSMSGHVAELRRKYDARSSISTRSVRSSSASAESISGVAKTQPKASGVVEDAHEGSPELGAGSESHFAPRVRPSSRSSSTSQQSDSKLQQHEDALRQHIAYAHNGQYPDPNYDPRLSQSMSSAGSADAYPPYPYPPQMALQPYHYPTPPASIGYPTPPHSMNDLPAPIERMPAAPDAPDLTQRTLTGYEKLAVELSDCTSSVKPMYRKFDYLNHRLLLHLQDEISELEEQLRLMDEIVAQMDPAASSDVPRTPSSRRGDAYSTSDIHHRRTALLGRIFIKTEQYNRAMSSYAAMNKECRPAEPEQIHAYKAWMSKHTPIHEDEAKFLHNDGDLVLPGLARTAAVAPPAAPYADAAYRPTKHAALTCLPVALMLPLLLYSIIPTLGGRLLVTALIAVGAFMVAASTRIRHLMPMNEWAVCSGAYVLLMTAIAGCIPQHAQ